MRASALPLRDLFGHPRGLFFATGTEFSDRLSFHGMQALLVLYMVGHLLLPEHVETIAGLACFRRAIEAVTGPLSAQAFALQTFGLYIGCINLIPTLGGWLGDRVLGRQRAVVLGALLMTIGHLCMAFEAAFLVALVLLVVGQGILRGNLLSQVGSLYPLEDSRRERGFQLFYALGTIGSFLAPIVTGTLAELYGWHYGFGFAALGMLAGLALYLSGRRYLPHDAIRKDHRQSEQVRFNAQDRRAIAILLATLPLATLFWVAQAQIWDTYPLWVRDHLDLAMLGFRVPVPWLQAVDALASVLVIPPVLLLWRWQARRSTEPDDITKLALGCLIFGTAVVILAVSGSPSFVRAFPKVPFLWAVAFHILSSVGWAYFGPTIVAIFSRAAPISVNAMMLGAYNLSIFAGGIIAGRLGSLYERVTIQSFWLFHAALAGAGGLLFLVFGSRLRRNLGIVLPAAAKATQQTLNA